MSALRLLNDLRGAITDGTLRSGVSLDKVSSYCSAYGLSNGTVLQMFGRLESGGLVYKSGKRRIVGNAPAPQTQAVKRHRGIVVAVVRYPGYWRHYLNSFHVAPMLQSLIWELDKYGVGKIRRERDLVRPCRSDRCQ